MSFGTAKEKVELNSENFSNPAMTQILATLNKKITRVEKNENFNRWTYVQQAGQNLVFLNIPMTVVGISHLEIEAGKLIFPEWNI